MADLSSSIIDHPTTTAHIWPPPPPDESDSEKARRIEQEKEAKRVSDAIDQAIVLERTERRKREVPTKILLLGELSLQICQSPLIYQYAIGQAESGKSTILKNFQLLFAPKSFYAEVEAWKAVIHLNLVRSVNFILDLLEDPRSPSTEHRRSPSATASRERSSNDLRFLKMRLAPLRQVEQMLSRRLFEVPICECVTGRRREVPANYAHAWVKRSEWTLAIVAIEPGLAHPGSPLSRGHEVF